MSPRDVTAKGVSITKTGFNKINLLKPVVFIICLLPLIMAVVGVATNKFVDPVDSLLHMTGEWGLRLLLVTLCVTPVQHLLKWAAVAKLRRMLGLFSFFYATVHLSVWLVLDQGMNFRDVVWAIIENKFITVGMVAWIGLLVLAVTSNRFSVRKLGRRWKSLHNWVYVLVLLAVVHFIWQVRASEILEPSMYLGVLALLLVWRFLRIVKR